MNCLRAAGASTCKSYSWRELRRRVLTKPGASFNNSFPRPRHHANSVTALVDSMQGAGWNERVAVPAARDAKTLRVTVAGPDGVLGAAEHPLHKVSGIKHVASSVIPSAVSPSFRTSESQLVHRKQPRNHPHKHPACPSG